MLTCLDCGHSYRQSVWNFSEGTIGTYGFESIKGEHELVTYGVSWITTCPFCGARRHAREVYVLADVMFGAKVGDESDESDESEGEE